MTEQVVTTLLQQLGATGAVLIAAGWALRALQRQLHDTQEKRIADAQAATTKLLELVKSQHEQQVVLAEAIDGNADAIRELRLLIETLVRPQGLPRR